MRLGEQSLDQEFMVSQGSGLFINTMMGWPMVPSADLYAGGPAYHYSCISPIYGFHILHLVAIFDTFR